MEIIAYSDRSIAVIGDTKSIKDELKELGGKFNPNLKTSENPRFPGWIFSNKKEQEVRNLIDSVQGGTVNNVNNNVDILDVNNDIGTGKTYTRTKFISNTKPIVLVPKNITKIVPETQLTTTSNNINYPNNFVASDGVSYQIIIQTCPLPKLDQTVILKFRGTDYEYKVVKFNVSNPVTDIQLMSLADNSIIARAVILNGKWQLFATEENHEFTF